MAGRHFLAPYMDFHVWRFSSRSFLSTAYLSYFIKDDTFKPCPSHQCLLTHRLIHMTFLKSQSVKQAANLTLAVLILSGCAANKAKDTKNNSPMFTEVKDIIPFEDRMRRKWDNPVIADLDQDGLQDIIINEHGYGVKVFWNNGRAFSRAQDIVKGDMHGIAIADFDRDGRTDLIIAQGGGDGQNPKRPVWFQVNQDRTLEGGASFDYFAPGRGRSIKFIDSGLDGELDLLVTGFPLKSQKQGANHFYQNIGVKPFEFTDILPQAKWLGYRSVTTDLNGDHTQDILFFGGENFIAVENNGDGTFSQVNNRFSEDVSNTSDISNIVEIDFDNDGDFDLFVTRSEAQFDIESYYDKDSKRFAFLTFRKEFNFSDLEVEGNLLIENLQRTIPDRTVFIGAQKRQIEFQADEHGHHDLTLSTEEASGWPDDTSANGIYIGYLGEGMWRIGGKTHSRSAVALRNVISEPLVTPQQDLPVRMLENREGIYVDVTSSLGISINEQTTGATVGDFDNNGWSDLAILRYGSMAKANEHIVYLNQGNNRFVKAPDHGIFANEVGTTGGSVEAFDYNRDGAMDLVFSNERGRWHLLRNNLSPGSEGNFTVVQVSASPSEGATPLAAELNVKACGNHYIRKVGSTSAAFSQSLNTNLHIGVGSCEQIDSATLRWSNGEKLDFEIGELNKLIKPGS